jgi:hypothetical protein
MKWAPAIPPADGGCLISFAPRFRRVSGRLRSDLFVRRNFRGVRHLVQLRPMHKCTRWGGPTCARRPANLNSECSNRAGDLLCEWRCTRHEGLTQLGTELRLNVGVRSPHRSAAETRWAALPGAVVSTTQQLRGLYGLCGLCGEGLVLTSFPDVPPITSV